MLDKLPEVYTVKLPENNKQEFLRLAKIACTNAQTWIGSEKLYKFDTKTKQGFAITSYVAPEVSFEDWKRLLEPKKELTHYQVQCLADRDKEFLRLLTLIHKDHEYRGVVNHYYEINDRRIVASRDVLISNVPILTIPEWRELLEGVAPTFSTGTTILTRENAKVGLYVIPSNTFDNSFSFTKEYDTITAISDNACMVTQNNSYWYLHKFYIYEKGSNNFSQIKQQQNEQHNNVYKANLFVDHQSYGQAEKPRGYSLRLRTSPTFFSSKQIRNSACSL